MQNDTSTKAPMTAQSSLCVFDDAAFSSAAADVITPAQPSRPLMLLPQAKTVESDVASALIKGNTEGDNRSSFLRVAPEERFSPEGALLSPVQILTNRLLAEAPAVNDAVKSGNQLINNASEIVEKVTGATTSFTKETSKEVTESVRELWEAARGNWQAPDNNTRLALAEQTQKIVELAKDVDDSDRMDSLRRYWNKATEYAETLTDTIYSELGYVKVDEADTATVELKKAEKRLAESLVDLRDREDFEDIIATAFGEQADTTKAKQLLTNLAEGTEAPDIQVVSGSELQGQAAFGDNTIFVSEKHLSENVDAPEVINAALMEETGHYLDSQLNSTDSAGDEGNIFALLAAQGEELSAEELATLKAEDDRGTLAIGDETIEVEYSWGSFTSGLSSFASGVSDSFSSGLSSVSNSVSNTWDSATDTVSNTWDSVTDTVSDTWSSTTDTVSNSWDNATDTVSDTWNNTTDTFSNSWDNATDTVSNTWDSTTDSLSDTWSNTIDTVSNTWDNATDTFSSGLDSVSNSVSNSWDTATDTVSNTWDSVTDTADSWNDSFSESLAEANDSFSNTWESTTDSLSNGLDSLTSTASNTWDSTTDTVSNTWDNFSTSATDTFSNTWESTTDTFSSGFDSFSDGLSNTWDAASNTVTDTVDSVVDTTTDAWDNTTDFVADTWDSAVDTTTDTIDDVSEGFSNTVETVTEKVEDTADAITDTYDSATDFAAETVDDIQETATEKWNDVSDFTTQTVEDISESAAETWDEIVETTAEIKDDAVELAGEAKDATVEFVTEDVPEFVTEDVPEWIAENESTINRGLGVVQVIGGASETALGVALMPTGAVSAGAGTVGGGLVAAHGIDNVIAGAKAVWTGESQDTYTQQGITAVADAVPGVSTETAETIGLVGDIGIGIAAPIGATRKLLQQGADEVVGEVVEATVRNSTDEVVGTFDDVAEEALDNFDNVSTQLGDELPESAGIVSNADEGSTTFFHGTTAEAASDIRTQGIDLSRGNAGSDFGQGFYLTTSSDEALLSAGRNAEADELLDVVQFDIPNSELDRLSGLNFPEPDADWQDFVKFHKTFEPESLMHGGEPYDFVTGPLFRRYTGADDIPIAWPDRVPQTSIHTPEAADTFNRFTVPK